MALDTMFNIKTLHTNATSINKPILTVITRVDSTATNTSIITLVALEGLIHKKPSATDSTPIFCLSKHAAVEEFCVLITKATFTKEAVVIVFTIGAGGACKACLTGLMAWGADFSVLEKPLSTYPTG